MAQAHGKSPGESRAKKARSGLAPTALGGKTVAREWGARGCLWWEEELEKGWRRGQNHSNSQCLLSLCRMLH